MKPILRFLTLLLALAGLIRPSSVQAQGTSFSCDGTFYQIRQVGTTSSIFKVDRSNATAYTTTALNVVGGTSNNLGVLLNGLAYNPADGYLYAITTPGVGGSNNNAPIYLYKIGQSGIVQVSTTAIKVSGAAANLGITVASGSFDKLGNYYFSAQNTGGTADYKLYKLLVSSATPTVATAVTMSGTPTFYDFALNPIDGLLYAADFNGSLYTVNPTNGTTTTVATAPAANRNAANAVGTIFFDIAGNLFTYTNGTVLTSNSSKFYQVNTTSGAYTLISSIDPASVSDGASCINPGQRIDVTKEAVNVVAISTTEFDVTYNIRVRNSYTATDDNVQVSDFVGQAFPTATVTISVPPTVTNVANGSAVAPTLAPNPAFNGGSNASLLTGTQALTPDQEAVITFTARVTYSAAVNVPTTAQNNTAYATSTTAGPNPNNGYRLASNGTTLLSPNDLVANDQSTNSTGYPASRIATSGNAVDAASPTPVTFLPSISGVVFEDVNYGGGAGRNRATSSGVGRPGARVELYNGTGPTATFSQATLTTSDGSYSFLSLTAGNSYTVRVVNSSVTSSRSGATFTGNATTQPGFASTQVAVQTFRTTVNETATSGTISDPNRVGGENPTGVDAAANMTSMALGTSVESISNVILTAAKAPALGVDFGYNFDTVVNTNDTGQGSLRQFILNSNALGGEADLAQVYTPTTGATTALTTARETSIFMIPNGKAVAGQVANLTNQFTTTAGTNTAATIKLATALADVTGPFTAIDGSTQTRSTGDSNATVAGVTTGPEVILDFNQIGGLYVTGSDVRVASVGLNNAKNVDATVGNSRSAGVTIFGAAAARAVITDITTLGNVRAGVRIESTAGVANVSVTNSVLSNNSANTSDADGLELLGATNGTFTGNVISKNKGYGIYLVTNANTGNNISNNTISGNGTGTAAANAGINIAKGDNNLFSNNIITNNDGDGIVALNGTSGNRFTRNNISNNGGKTAMRDLGIDLLQPNATANNDGVSLNSDGKTDASGANGLLNFPVFTQATIDAGRLYVSGYVKAGALVEIFVASADPSGFGEGATYSFSATEGTSNDTDPRFASYSATSGIPAGSPNQGSETGVSRFIFSFNVTSAQITDFTTKKLTATATVLSGTTVNGTPVGNTSEFSAVIAVTNNKPLPVELTAFTAVAKNLDAQLAWKTAQEKNNDHFNVERSLNGTDFAKIGEVRGQGSKTTPTDYAFTDGGIGTKASGTVYYRLQQVDADGTATFSPVRTVQFGKVITPAISLAPNPATTGTQLDLSLLSTGRYEVLVLDATGRKVLSATLEAGLSHALDLSRVASGSYHVVVRGQNNGQLINLTKRLIKE